MITQRGNIAQVNWVLGEINVLNSSECSLNAEETSQLNSFRNAQRKKEFKAVRHLKQQIFGETLIRYGENGKPFINKPEVYIGISHSSNLALFAYSNIPFGCDIEEVTDRITPLADRFCSMDELGLFEGEAGSIQLTHLWSCKEAIYKLVNIQGIHWKNEMICTEIAGSIYTFNAFIGSQKIKVRCESILMNEAIFTIATYA